MMRIAAIPMISPVGSKPKTMLRWTSTAGSGSTNSLRRHTRMVYRTMLFYH